jgi:hypothetical protein
MILLQHLKISYHSHSIQASGEGKYMFNLRRFLGLSYYVSDADRFLEAYDKAHARTSASQQAEINKYKRVHAQRDKAVSFDDKTKIWDKF